MLGINDLKIEDIRAIADVINEKNLDSISIENDDIAVTIKAKREPKVIAGMPAGVSVTTQTTQSSPVVNGAVEQKTEISGNVVKSPIVGTYYNAPAPGKPAFIEVGKHVSKGDVLMIIESMKLMNEIQSEFDGVVEDILVSNGDAVEFDQPLVVIK